MTLLDGGVKIGNTKKSNYLFWKENSNRKRIFMRQSCNKWCRQIIVPKNKQNRFANVYIHIYYKTKHSENVYHRRPLIRVRKKRLILNSYNVPGLILYHYFFAQVDGGNYLNSGIIVDPRIEWFHINIICMYLL